MTNVKFIIDTQDFLDRYHNPLFLVLFGLVIVGEVYLYAKMQDNAKRREEYTRVIKTFDKKVDEMNKELEINNKERQVNMAMIRRLEKLLKSSEKV